MPLSRDDVIARLRECPGWGFDGKALSRTLTFPSFADAIAFVTRLAFDAEAADHHPDLQISYRTVIVRWNTHSEGGVTDKDFEGVTQTEHAFGRRA